MTDFLKDVADSSPEDDHLDDVDDIDTNADADPEEGDAGEGEGEDGGEPKGRRTIDNVYRELSRKQEKFQENLMGMMLEQQRLMREAITGIKREPDRKSGSLDDMSVQELESFRAQVAEHNPEKLAEYDSYLTKRRVDEAVNVRMKQHETKSQIEARRREANQAAVSRYPELARRGSEFYRAVNTRLQELGEDYVSANPRAVLDAANDVAAERGVAPVATRMRQRGSVANRNNAPANKGRKGSEELSLPKSAASPEARAAIARRLQGALPKGKKFDDAKIAERTAAYFKDVNQRVRG